MPYPNTLVILEPGDRVIRMGGHSACFYQEETLNRLHETTEGGERWFVEKGNADEEFTIFILPGSLVFRSGRWWPIYFQRI